MLMAIARVHWPKGLWVTHGGFEYPLTIIVLTVAVALAGPGRYALDPYLGMALPLVPLLVAGLLAALVVAAVVARPHPAVRTEMRRTA
jgi:putative oxidoreductase